jgi:hypothetical protein
MAQFYEGGAAMYDALVYARPHENTMQFLQHQAHNFYQNLTEAGKQFAQAAHNLYDSIGLSWGAQQLRALGRMVQNIWQPDQIRPLVTLQDFQQAPPVMQRWVMAMPEIRSLYQKQLVEGYAGQYVDRFQGAIGDNHYDYRMMTSGVVQETEDGWKSRTTYEELLPNDRELLPADKIDLAFTRQRLIAQLLHPSADPSSITGDERGV